MATCLIVDEAPVIRKVASRVVLKLGHEADSVEDAEEARAWISANGLPDLMIVGVPGGDDAPIALIAEIRARPGGREPIILASIVGRNLGLMTRCHRAGSNGFVDKPFEGEEFEGVIRHYLAAGGAEVAA